MVSPTMQGLSAAELLRAWEVAFNQSPSQRALTVLVAACPDIPYEVLAHVSIGERDAQLLTLRAQTFGSRLNSLANCPRCNAPLELSFDVSDVRAKAVSLPSAKGDVTALSFADCEVSFRLPNSLDLLAVADSGDVALGRQSLFERCVLSARHHGEDCPTGLLPPLIIDAVAAQMAQADPQADVQLALSCPECGQQWKAIFDIVSFFWAEISAWATRILREVHVLASAYGWREADILALSPHRRQCYLDMVGV